MKALILSLFAALFLTSAISAPDEDVYYSLDGKEMVVLTDDVVYTVPAGKQLIILGVGCTDWDPAWREQTVDIVVSGIPVDRCTLQWANPPSTTHPGTIDDVQSVRINAAAGDTVLINARQFTQAPNHLPTGTAWGVLIPEEGISLTGSILEVPSDKWGYARSSETVVLEEGEMIVFTEIGMIGIAGLTGDRSVEIKVNGTNRLFARMDHRETLSGGSLEGKVDLSSDRAPNIPAGFHFARPKNTGPVVISMDATSNCQPFIRYYTRPIE